MTKASKAESREILKAKRNALTENEAAELSLSIIARCMELIPWSDTHSLHTYLPVIARREVDAWHLAEYAFIQASPNILTAVPVMVGKTMRAIKITPETTWLKNSLGIPEPINGEELATEQQFDVIIVPMLGFDEQGYRIGNGGGHYDQFLAEQSGSLTIGLSYEACCLGEPFAHAPHDVPLKYIVTERRTLSI